MDTNDQIAAEAWLKIQYHYTPDMISHTGQTGIAIIQAAIEKAYRQGLKDGREPSEIAGIKVRWPHASEPLTPDERASINEFAMTQGKPAHASEPTLDRFSAEAAYKLTGDTKGAAYRAAFETIKTAIEKATEQIRRERDDALAVRDTYGLMIDLLCFYEKVSVKERDKELSHAHASEDEKDLTAVPVLAEPLHHLEGRGEARQAPMNVATAVNPAYENVQQTSNRIETPYEKGQTDSEAVSGSGVQDLRKRTEGLSRKQSAKSKISSQMEGENSGTERQNSQTVSVRELRSDSDTGRASPELREATGSDVALSSLSQRDLTTDSRGGSQPL